MYTIDLGVGVRLYSSPRNALILGYRYQHLSNANISVHNPGTEADTLCIGFSHFHNPRTTMTPMAACRVASTLAATLFALTPVLPAQQTAAPLLVSRAGLLPAISSSTPVAAISLEAANLADAPEPAADLLPRSEAASGAAGPPKLPETKMTEVDRNTACEEGELHGKPCRVSWGRLLAESFYFLSTQHLGNIAMDSDTRNALTDGKFWGDYFTCVENYRWSRWKDDDPFVVDYIGHPMMGAITNAMYEQNDPKQRALTYENTHGYWFGRLRATAYSAAYSAQWKIGPVSEASIGNTGIGYYIRLRDGLYTNETGMQDFFITPIGGLAWNVGEDAIDRYFLRRIQNRSRVVRFLASFTTPARSAANLSRFRAPYYRDEDRASLLAH